MFVVFTTNPQLKPSPQTIRLLIINAFGCGLGNELQSVDPIDCGSVQWLTYSFSQSMAHIDFTPIVAEKNHNKPEFQTIVLSG